MTTLSALPKRGSAESPWSVDELSEAIGRVVGAGFPGRLWVEGELSQVRPSGGNVWFSLREGKAVLGAVAWREAARRLPEGLRQGDQIRALGSVRTWKGQSRYQFVVDRVERAGLGELLQTLREIEIRLTREGLFAPERKRPLPRTPLRVGLLTSRGSDAWRDFLQTATGRFPGIEILSWHSRVQGAGAPRELVAGLRELAREAPDFIVITRGGGSFEDLLAFSDEALLRAVAACPVPVVSAIGHENDRPLLDQAADVRSKTPTAAAEEHIPDHRELREELDDRRQAAERQAEQRLSGAGRSLEARAHHRGFSAFPHRLGREQDRVENLRSRLGQAALGQWNRRSEELEPRRRKLETLHPGVRLERQKRDLAELRNRITALAPLDAWWPRLPSYAARLAPDRLRRLVEDGCRTTSRAAERAEALAGGRLERFTARSENRGERLRAQNPLLLLKRGYSLVFDSGGKVLVSVEGLAAGEPVRIQLADGDIEARVLEANAASEERP